MIVAQLSFTTSQHYLHCSKFYTTLQVPHVPPDPSEHKRDVNSINTHINLMPEHTQQVPAFSLCMSSELCPPLTSNCLPHDKHGLFAHHGTIQFHQTVWDMMWSGSSHGRWSPWDAGSQILHHYQTQSCGWSWYFCLGIPKPRHWEVPWRRCPLSSQTGIQDKSLDLNVENNRCIQLQQGNVAVSQ